MPKFRAWDTINKEMFEDTFAITESGQVVVVKQESIVSFPEYVFVNHLVIMQFTDFKDTDGNEVFEGDKLGIETETSIIYVNVVWDSEHAMFMAYSEEYNEKEPLVELLKDTTYPFYVVGNIYEDKELMEKN